MCHLDGGDLTFFLMIDIAFDNQIVWVFSGEQMFDSLILNAELGMRHDPCQVRCCVVAMHCVCDKVMLSFLYSFLGPLLAAGK